METEAPIVVVLPITNKKGLHARATAKFVKTASEFNAHIKIAKIERHNGEISAPVSGTSILGVMMLGAEPGSSVQVTASGEQAQEAIAAITKLLEEKFGED